MPRRSSFGRAVLGVWVVGVCLIAGIGCQGSSPEPRPGLVESERNAVERIGDVRVHLAHGNVSSDRVDLVLDTRVAPLVVGAVFNSATGHWAWRHDMRLAGGVFFDDSGAELDVGAVVDGAAIPGTHWVRVDETRIKTKGGLVHRFDPITGRLVEVHWSDGSYPALRYVADPSVPGRLDRIEQCVSAASCSVQLTIEYDAAGCVLAVVDRAGRTADYLHERLGATCRPLVARDPFDVERDLPGRRYAYGVAGRLRAIVNSEDERIELDWSGDNIARVRRVGHGDPEVRFGFVVDVGGRRTVAVKTTASGAVWVYEFDAEQRLSRMRSPEGDVVTQTWSGRRPTSRTDASGRVWRYDWVDDDLVRVEQPSGAAEVRVYAPGAVDRRHPERRPVLLVTDDLGTRQVRSFDASGRMISSRNGAGDTTHFEWDALGQLARATLPDGVVIEYHDYGEHGHAARVVRGEVEEVRLFDAVGNLEKGASVQGELGPGRPGLVRRRFDADRNVAEVVTVETALDDLTIAYRSTTITRRSDGRALHIARPYGGDEWFEYDAHGRLIERRERVDGVDRVTSIEFDIDARPKRSVLPNGMKTEVDWDRDGRLVRIEHTRPGTIWQWVTLTYAQGRVVEIGDSAYATPESIAHDVDGRVQRIDHASGGRSELEYDARGREVARRIIDPTTGGVAFEARRSYDGADRLVSTWIDGELLIERERVDGRPSAVRYGNGLTRTFAYHPATGELIESRTQDAAGVSVERTDLVRDAGYERLDVTVTSRILLAGPPGGAPIWHRALEVHRLRWGPTAYDGFPTPGPWLRMSSQNDILETPVADRVRFDALGNLDAFQPRGGPATEFTMNAERNRLLAGGFDATRTYATDEAGFVVSRDGVALGWTAGGRLASIGASVSLAWDARNRLRSRTIDGVTTRFGYGGRVEVDAVGRPIAAEIDGVGVALGSGARRYRHHDDRGNVLFVSDEQAAVVRRHVYAGFGERAVFDRDGTERAPGSGERGFAGGLHVAGMMLLGARPYDPAIGRFLAPDPVDHVLNDFAYTRGNPVHLWDPGGTHATPVGGAPSQTPAGQATVTVGVGFMAMGASMAGNAVAAGPLAGQFTATGVIIFVGGVVLVYVGTAMLDSPDPPTMAPPVPPPAESTDALPDGDLGSGSTCSPDAFRPRTSGTPRAVIWLLLLAAVVGLMRRAEVSG